jgi:non-reducing end alpha-L-arabinofuranosidase
MTIRSRLRYVIRALMLAGAALALAAGALAGASAGAGVPAARAASSLPCDIYAAGGTPCVAAYSTTRALYASYNGPLYQVHRSSDGGNLNIGLLSAGGDASAASQASFCAGTACTITKIYDQGPNHSDLPISSGGFWKGPGPNGSDVGANAMALPIMISGHQAYGIRSTPGTGYRVDNIPVPTGSQPEGVYMVTSSNLFNNQCCFDFGTGETSHTDTGNAHMNAIEWGNACWFGGCTGPGPWVEADLENGMYSTNTGPNSASNPGVNFPFVSAWEKNNGTSNFTLKDGNATTGGLTTTWSGPLPNGYSPMHEEADILLGTGGDNSNGASGEFFEGAVTSGFPSDATENSVQASITAAGYSSSSGSGATGPITSGLNGAKCADDANGSGANGNKVQMWDCDGFAAAQNWTVNSNGTLTIDGGCLDITGANFNNGTLVELWTCNGGGNQQWTATNGTLVNPASGKCLDDPNSNTANGTQLILWSCNGGANQQWHLP